MREKFEEKCKEIGGEVTKKPLTCKVKENGRKKGEMTLWSTDQIELSSHGAFSRLTGRLEIEDRDDALLITKRGSDNNMIQLYG